MIKATEARVITKSGGLDRNVLDKIQNAIIAVASKGGPFKSMGRTTLS